MPPRDVLLYPHPDLKHVCEPVEPGPEAERVARDLIDTMVSFGHCVGVAAPQVGELVRMVVVDVTAHRKAKTSNGLLVLANPRIESSEGDELGREGCLSIPEFTADVRRQTRIRVRAYSPSGEEIALESEGFEARALQHELDHLDGVLFLDRIATLNDLFPRKVAR